VRCKRSGLHAWNSMDVERHVGRTLLQLCPGARVDLEAPEVVVKVEIHHDEMFVVERTLKGWVATLWVRRTRCCP
jgi:thiamine biosynthesis protein ThiI